jgi:hypothetical protein
VDEKIGHSWVFPDISNKFLAGRPEGAVRRIDIGSVFPEPDPRIDCRKNIPIEDTSGCGVHVDACILRFVAWVSVQDIIADLKQVITRFTKTRTLCLSWFEFHHNAGHG